MATDNFNAGPSSGLLNGQLFATADAGAILPPAPSYVTTSVGAGSSMIPGLNAGGGAINTGPQGVAGDATPEMAGQTHSSGSILGMPSIVVAVLVVALLGYIFIWQVNFK